MKINDQIYLIGSGRFGSNMSNQYDCNVYAIDLGEAIAIIDAGVGLEPDRIVTNAVKMGLDPNKIRYLLLTHYHGDHAGGAYFWKENFNVEVFASAAGADWLEQGNEAAISLDLARNAGGYPSDYYLQACRVDHRIQDGEKIELPGLTLAAIDTPGHSNAHVSYYGQIGDQNVLFAGDTVFSGGKILLQNIYDCSIQLYASTVEKLSKLEIDILLSGHQIPILSRGTDTIGKAHEIFMQLGIPSNLS